MKKLLPLLIAVFLFGSLTASVAWAKSEVEHSPHMFEGEHSSRIAQAFSDPLPRFGDQKLLILLVDFPDRPGLFTGQQWHEYFFGANRFSDYYQEVSYHQLRYTGDIVGMLDGSPVLSSTNVAYIRLANPLTYYADNNYGWTMGAFQFPKNNGGVVYHALQALDAAGFNFAPYADPVTNKVENLIVVFAGSSFAVTRDNVNSLEATAYSLNWAGLGASYVSLGGQIFNNYTFCPDQRGNLSGEPGYLGICAHEHGHGLGMPDLYDYSYITTGVGRFDLMAYGQAYSDKPFHFGAFTKSFYGWITPTVILTGTTEITLTAVEREPQVLKLYPHGDSNAQEYFLLENRQAINFDGDWSSNGLCPGLVIWHVDNAIVQNPTAFFAVNSRPPYIGAPPHPGVIVVEADGDFAMSTLPQNYGGCADTWAVGRTWNATSTPSSALWTNEPSGLSVTVLGQTGDSVNLSITVGDSATGGDTHLLYLPIVGR